MFISEKYNFIFIHNQRAAGTSITNYLNQHAPDTYPLLPQHAYAIDGINKLTEKTWNHYYSFGFVRNPWDRLASWYSKIIEGSQTNHDNYFWKYVTDNSSNFEDFLYNCTDTISDDREVLSDDPDIVYKNKDGFVYQKSILKNQLDYFSDKEGKIVTSFIGRFENLHQDFNTVLKNLSLPQHELPLINKVKDRDYRLFYNNETRELVAQRFKKDIEYFGYSFDQ